MATGVDVALECAALPDVLVHEARVREALSEVTLATIRCTSQHELDLEAALGSRAIVVALVDGVAVRHFHLIVTGTACEGIDPDGRVIHTIELAHELHFLKLRSDVRMFQSQAVSEIVASVLVGANIPAERFSFALRRDLKPREYCVQHRESDYAFIARLLADEGITFFAGDDDISTHLYFTDDASAFEPFAAHPVVPLLDDDGHGIGVRDLVVESRVVPERATLSDYNFRAPAVDLTKSSSAGSSPRGDWFEYPGGYETPADGADYSRIRLEELLATSTVARGRAESWSFRAGCWFELDGAARSSFEGRYVLRAVEHTFSPRGPGERGPGYENRFVCSPASLPWRPPRPAARPRIAGAQSVVVTGPPGQEIHTDSFGRMKAKFFWDRLGKEDDTSSCWMRVTQLPIGGSMALARVGWEMAVVFVDGDPDRPITVARLYNAEKTSPYAYPAAKTRMALQTPSSPGGGKSNEIRMEDGAGRQELFLNASKDLDVVTNATKTETVAVDETVSIGTNAEITVGATQTARIGGSRSMTIGSDAGVKVGSSRTKMVGGSETVSVGGNATLTVGGAASELTGGTHTTMAVGAIGKTSTGSYALTVGGAMVSGSGDGVSFAVAGAKSESVGGAKIAAAGESVTESIVGAMARTVGGVAAHAAGGNAQASTTASASVTVGGVLAASAGGKVHIKAPVVTIQVAGTANLLGGGGALNITPGSIAMGSQVTVDASGSIVVSGNPNLLG